MLTVLSIFHKWENAAEQAVESEEDFVSLCASVGEQKCALWAAEEADAQEKRDQDPTAMDIFDVKEEEGLSILCIPLFITDKSLYIAPGKTVMANVWIYRELQPNTSTIKGSTSWITSGIRITEQQ